MKISRVYHPYWAWEEVAHNMWGSVPDRRSALRDAVTFTGNHRRYGAAMMRVVGEWPISCENALTDRSLNQKAWVGHAACALAIQCPEDIVRQAWGLLTDEQRFLANKEANRAIRRWRLDYCARHGVREQVGEQMLLEWDPG